MGMMRYQKTIDVYPATETVGSAGQTEITHAAIAVPVRCNVHPLSVVELQFWGDRGKDMRTVACASWPGDMQSRLVLDGEEWEQAQPEQAATIGTRTKHVEVVIRRR